MERCILVIGRLIIIISTINLLHANSMSPFPHLLLSLSSLLPSSTSSSLQPCSQFWYCFPSSHNVVPLQLLTESASFVAAVRLTKRLSLSSESIILLVQEFFVLLSCLPLPLSCLPESFAVAFSFRVVVVPVCRCSWYATRQLRSSCFGFEDEAPIFGLIKERR